MGRSPFVIVQEAETASSKFTSSSPNENGMMVGRTFKVQIAKFIESKKRIAEKRNL
jgi:hypothetical protein